MKYMQGIFKPKHIAKYKGDISNIIYRSSLELRYMIWLDDNPDIIQWSSEQIYLPYLDKANKRSRLYFPDFHFKTITGKEYLCEIKPFRECKPPTNKKSKNYIKEARTFITNQSKWESAKKFAKLKGMEFVVITEKDLAKL